MRISDKKSVAVSKDMYGLFFEDINYGLDGGLHAELLENRNFEAVFAAGKKDDYTVVYDGSYAWSVYEDNGNGSAIHMDSSEPLNDVNPHYLVFDGKGGTPSIKNKAYDGIYAKKGQSYHVHFYAKILSETPDAQKNITISVRKYGEIIVQAVILAEGNTWKKYECTLVFETDVQQGDFVVSLDGEASVAFDQFSMMPKDTVCGVFRKDLAEKLKALEPSFLRFPGGCIVEGNTLKNCYHWKDTIAPAEERKFNWNRWAVHNNNPENEYSGPFAHYGQTYGVGYYEYFLLCEYLGAKPLPVMNVGLACQFMSSEKVDIESEEMQKYIQDALDLIEFANGGTDTEWGRKRAQMGHPAPFGLEYLGIGNEQWQTEKINFYGRYEMFEQAIHEKYPEIRLIGSAGPDVWGGGYFRAWDWAKKAAEKNENLVYAIDEHYYVAPEWLYDHVHFYDHYDRKIKVFAGEYACHIPGRAGKMNFPSANTMEAALAEAAFLTGIERNADVVVLASYAPLFARMGYTQWSPDLIWFDGEDSYVTPSYYVQQLYSRYRGERTLETDFGWDGETEKKEKLYASAVQDAQGNIILKVVNANEEERKIPLETEGLLPDGTAYEVRYIQGEKDAQNSIYEKDNIVIQQTDGKLADGAITVKGNSFSVFIFKVA
jgi:alpha-L-arabinofuranosidase